MPLAKPSIRWKDNIKRIPKREDGALTGLLWHRTGKGGGAVVNAAMNVRINKMRGIP
jgi:hypothetical protein